MKNLYEPIGEADDFQPEFFSNFLDGIITLSMMTKNDSKSLTAIPYYAWGNRGSGQMKVWVGAE